MCASNRFGFYLKNISIVKVKTARPVKVTSMTIPNSMISLRTSGDFPRAISDAKLAQYQNFGS